VSPGLSAAVNDVRVVVPDGVLLQVESSGQGPAVLLIHGLGYAAWAGSPLRDRLVAAGYRYITFENRGTGRSDKAPGPYSIGLMARDAAAVVESVAEGPIHVIGYSMGGYVALSLATHRPELVATLTLIATSAGGRGSVDVPEATRQAWSEASDLSPADFARATMPLSFRHGWVESHQAEFEAILQARLAFPTPASVWRAQFEASARHLHDGLDVRGVLAPALVIHGTDDRVVPHANGEVLAGLLPNARLELISGAGHLSWIEEPDLVASTVVDFLSAGAAHAATLVETSDHS
jgi:3-oxoadipate enol-lactonase